MEHSDHPMHLHEPKKDGQGETPGRGAPTGGSRSGKSHQHGKMSMEHGSHDHHRMMIRDFRKRFIYSTILSIPILALSPMIQHFIGYSLEWPGQGYLLFLLSSAVYFWGGWPFLKGFFSEWKKREPGMMTLIAMAISVAYFYSSATVFGLQGADFFWELATLIDIMLLGHWLEMKSVLGASRALQLLVNMMPSGAHRLKREGEWEEVKLEDLNKKDIVLVRPGEKIPADGMVTEGISYVDESMLTGESRPVKKEKDNQVIGGSLNGNGSLQVRVEHTGKESYLNKVISLVEEAQKTKSRMQNLSDRAAKWLTYIALSIGFGTLAAWWLAGFPFVYALERMATVMVIACPHALGLAIPLVVAISTTVSAQNGLLIRNRTAFEESRKITALLFDKTGTLTTGVFGVSRFESVDPRYDSRDMMRLAGALEQSSEHPIGVGIIKKLKELKLDIPAVEEFRSIAGQGVQGRVEGKQMSIVSPSYLRDNSIEPPAKAFTSAAETIVFVMMDGKLTGYIALSDSIRPESRGAIAVFKSKHIKVYMATGDNKVVGDAVSNELGLDGFYAEVLPHEKVEIVKELQQRGEFVAMTGDGINDAPALAQADVGIAVGSGTDIAAETADIILVNSNPRDIANLILFGKATYRKMIQNLVWATGYNAIAIPLAAGLLYRAGIIMGPAMGAALMSLSTIIVAINAEFLKRNLNRRHD